jgi:hypothetical protein
MPYVGARVGPIYAGTRVGGRRGGSRDLGCLGSLLIMGVVGGLLVLSFGWPFLIPFGHHRRGEAWFFTNWNWAIASVYWALLIGLPIWLSILGHRAKQRQAERAAHNKSYYGKCLTDGEMTWRCYHQHRTLDEAVECARQHRAALRAEAQSASCKHCGAPGPAGALCNYCRNPVGTK